MKQAFSITVAGSTAFPGQPGNPVGHTAAPGFSGSLTTHPPSGFAPNTTYSFLDIDAGSSGTLIPANLPGINFVGCRFQSNAQAYYNVRCDAPHATFKYCSFVPRTAFYTSPPGAAWPSANAGVNNHTMQPGVNCIDGTKGFQYGLMPGPTCTPLLVQHCDCWGMGNDFVDLAFTAGASVTVDNCWIHDAANTSPNGYHIDGMGYVNGAAAARNVVFSNCTVASLGNANGIAFQTATSAYDNIVISGCYISGYGFTVAIPGAVGPSGATNCSFLNNVIGSDIQAYFGPIFANPTALYSGSTNKWRGNKFRYRPGTVPSSGGWAFNASGDGKFIWPDSTLHTTDFAG